MLLELTHYFSLSLFVIGTLWLLFLIFRDNIAQGIITLWLIPLIYMFVKMNWKKTQIPFVLHALGAVLLLYIQLADPAISQFTQTLITSDGKASIMLPNAWKKLKSTASGAQILAGDLRWERFLLISEVKKSDFPNTSGNELAIEFVYELKLKLKEVEAGKLMSTQINGINTQQRIMHVTENNRRVSYLYNILDSAEHYYLIIFWAPESRFDSSKNEILRILNSFELKEKPEPDA